VVVIEGISEAIEKHGIRQRDITELDAIPHV
jgi:hypothetical protein